MERQPKQSKSLFNRNALLAAGIILSLTALAGCSAENSNRPTLPGVGGRPIPSGGIKNTAAKKTGEGLEIAMASQLLCGENGCVNPFLNKLPKILEPVTPDMPENAGPVFNPFAGFNLLGVVFNSESATALIAVGANQDTATRLVKKGDLLKAGAGELRVAAIGRDYVELESLGEKGQKQVLSLPSILEYESQKRGEGGAGPTGSFAENRNPGGGGIIGNMMESIGAIGEKTRQAAEDVAGQLVEDLEEP